MLSIQEATFKLVFKNESVFLPTSQPLLVVRSNTANTLSIHDNKVMFSSKALSRSV